MEWSKIKNIIILILLCLNLFLLALVVTRENQSARYQEEARAGTVAALEKNGISFQPAQVPADTGLLPLNVTRSRQGEQAMAEALLGTVEREDTGGGVRILYTGPGGTASFTSDGRFQFDLTGQAAVPQHTGLEQSALDCLSLMGIRGTLTGRETVDDCERLTYCQMWEEVPVFSSRIVLTFRDRTLCQIQGEQLAGTGTPAEGLPLDTLTVLMRFTAAINESGYVCSRIDRMTDGYLSRVSAARPVVKLTPVWCIETDTGRYYVDTITGELIQTE